MTPLSRPLTDGVYRPAAEAEAKRVIESWGSLNWLVSQELTHTPDLTVGRVVIKTGMSNPKHSHPDSVEVLYLLRGTLRHVIGGDSVLMQAGDTTVVPAGVPHVAFSEGDEDAEMIVVYPTGHRQFKAEA
jgi:quercetin dioxygenase-like cupin family protein